jgi:hypothetical protein
MGRSQARRLAALLIGGLHVLIMFVRRKQTLMAASLVKSAIAAAFPCNAP